MVHYTEHYCCDIHGKVGVRLHIKCAGIAIPFRLSSWFTDPHYSVILPRGVVIESNILWVYTKVSMLTLSYLRPFIYLTT